MWILTPLQPGGATQYLLSSMEYVVGRKNCDILLPNDQSISRAHAHFTATDQTLTLKDTSKYGSFVNGQRVMENAPVNLKSGDNLTFGVFDSKFSVDHQTLVVCSSCLDNNGKTLLSQALLTLGGHLVNSWSPECTHLTMTSAKVTIKTISALLCCRPIVTPEFFSELSKAAQQKLPPPKANSFIPEIDEPSLNKNDVNLDINPSRKQIFMGKTFIFISAKQLKRLSAAVSFGGGKSQLLVEGSMPQDLLESPQSCVIDLATGNSQALLPFSTTEWAKSVKNIVQRNGRRVITESEIGLAAIYASCDHYCNPSGVITDSESVPKVNPRILSASLSQSVAVDETVLPAVSQNITAYAVNTESSQRRERDEVSEVMAVGETPEKKHNQNATQLHGDKPSAQRKGSECLVSGTISSSFNAIESTDAERKKPEQKRRGADNCGVWSPQSLPSPYGGTKTFLQKESPQKQKLSAQASPQKQPSLTSFFQPVSKKRPLEDELFAAVSKPKRPALDAALSPQAAKTSVTSKGKSIIPAETPQIPLGSASSDLFVGGSVTQTNRAQEEPQTKKRKEMEEEIQIDELESIMSEDMDYFDEPSTCNQSQQAELSLHGSIDKKPGLHTFKALSTMKRQRVYLEKDETTKVPQLGLENESGCLLNDSQLSKQHMVSVKTSQVHTLEGKRKCHEATKSAEVSSGKKSQKIKPFGDKDMSFVEDFELSKADICPPKEETNTPFKPFTIKQEPQESKIEEDLPQKLVIVEFRSLAVTAPPTAKPQQIQNHGHTKNFKCFCKIYVPGAKGSPHIIGGSELLVHNRGKNSDLDEWLKDVAEEAQQNKRDETVGDDLFRYNPTKLRKRR